MSHAQAGDQTPDKNWVAADDLTPDNRATLERNWASANEALDDMINLCRQHRLETGCTAWYCASPAETEHLEQYDIADMAQMLRMAVLRLAKQP